MYTDFPSNIKVTGVLADYYLFYVIRGETFTMKRFKRHPTEAYVVRAIHKDPLCLEQEMNIKRWMEEAALYDPSRQIVYVMKEEKTTTPNNQFITINNLRTFNIAGTAEVRRAR